MDMIYNEDSEKERTVHPNLKLLSYNSQKTLHGCARKFYLYRMLKTEIAEGREERNIHFDFGSLVGYGCQCHLVNHLTPHLIPFTMLLSWKGDLEEEETVKKKKTFYHALHAVERFSTLLRTELKDYELVYYDRKPATELGFFIDCGDGFSYRGFFDGILRHKITGKFAILEIKTEGTSGSHEAKYKNSSQGLGYSVVIDAIASRLGVLSGESYDIIYAIYTTKNKNWEIFKFRKNFTERALWIRNILLDIKRIADYSDAGYWPLQGEYCFSYFRPCEYFEYCNMSDKNLIGDVEKVKLLEEGEEGKEKYEFKFSLADLISAQIEKGETEI